MIGGARSTDLLGDKFNDFVDNWIENLGHILAALVSQHQGTDNGSRLTR